MTLIKSVSVDFDRSEIVVELADGSVWCQRVQIEGADWKITPISGETMTPAANPLQEGHPDDQG